MGASPRIDVRTKRIYEPADPADGTRVLIMRLWPRGIRKERVTVWLKELGPPLPLLRDFLDKRVDWTTYVGRYRAALQRPEAEEHVERVLALAREGPLTLICGCADERRCHRTLLRDELLARLL